MAFRFRPVFGNGNLSPFFYQLYKFYLRTVKYRYEFVHCHVAVSSVKLAANGWVACAVAELKVGSLMQVPKVERTYLLEPLHKAAIAQLPRVRAS